MNENISKTHPWGDTETRWCSICGMDFVGLGNNAEPVNNGRCCDSCNQQVVITRRINDLEITGSKDPRKEKG